MAANHTRQHPGASEVPPVHPLIAPPMDDLHNAVFRGRAFDPTSHADAEAHNAVEYLQFAITYNVRNVEGKHRVIEIERVIDEDRMTALVEEIKALAAKIRRSGIPVATLTHILETNMEYAKAWREHHKPVQPSMLFLPTIGKSLDIYGHFFRAPWNRGEPRSPPFNIPSSPGSPPSRSLSHRGPETTRLTRRQAVVYGDRL
ncbi:hypothetical protein JCM3766R1_006018 [Sporobolomyces carnicolor]